MQKHLIFIVATMMNETEDCNIGEQGNIRKYHLPLFIMHVGPECQFLSDGSFDRVIAHLHTCIEAFAAQKNWLLSLINFFLEIHHMYLYILFM